LWYHFNGTTAGTLNIVPAYGSEITLEKMIPEGGVVDGGQYSLMIGGPIAVINQYFSTTAQTLVNNTITFTISGTLAGSTTSPPLFQIMVIPIDNDVANPDPTMTISSVKDELKSLRKAMMALQACSSSSSSSSDCTSHFPSSSDSFSDLARPAVQPAASLPALTSGEPGIQLLASAASDLSRQVEVPAPTDEYLLVPGNDLAMLGLPVPASGGPSPVRRSVLQRLLVAISE